MVFSSGITEEDLEKAFDAQDTKKTLKITLAQVEKALQATGIDKSPEEAKQMVEDFKGSSSPPPAEATFDEFRDIAHQSKLPYAKKVDDVPVAGVFTSAMADAFGLYAHGKTPSEDKMKEVFDRLDTNKSKTLDKGEIANAFRQLGKSERQIQKIVDAIPEKEIDFDQFKALMYPEPRPYVHNDWVGGDYVPIPNREKILDVPVLGHVMNFAGHIVCEPTDYVARKFHKTKELTDEMLDKLFKKLDTDKDGKLTKKEVEGALREKGGFTEADIVAVINGMQGDKMSCYKFKKAMRGPKYVPSSANYVPAVGESLSTNIIGGEEYEDEDLKDAFDDVREDYYANAEKIDKTGLCRVCLELGMSEHLTEQIAESTDSDSFDLEGFKEAIMPKARNWTTESGMPNPGKIHDTPVLGAATKFTQDAAVGTYHWTVGAVVKKFKKPTPEELQAKWDEVDTKKAGKLSKKEVGAVLRLLNEPEIYILKTVDSIPQATKEVKFDDFKCIVNGETPSWG